MGQSILDPTKAPIAIGSNMDIQGNTKGVSPKEINRLKRAYRVADLLIRFNKLP